MILVTVIGNESKQVNLEICHTNQLSVITEAARSKRGGSTEVTNKLRRLGAASGLEFNLLPLMAGMQFKSKSHHKIEP